MIIKMIKTELSPDSSVFYMQKSITDVKINSLANNIHKQYNDRKKLFGNDCNITFHIDLRGQDYTEDMLSDITRRVKDLVGDTNILHFVRK